MNNMLTNKKQLDNYLEDFTLFKKEEILSLFNDNDFDCGVTVFKIKMKQKISMPQFGRGTLIYWTSRGWTKEESLLKKVKNIRKPEDSPMNKNFWIKRGYSSDDADFKVRSQRKTNKEYWLSRGFTMMDSLNKVIDFQKENNNKFINKLSNDDEFRENINSKRSNNINYWLNLGYSEDESKLKVSKRQATFSKKTCIDKHGEINGLKIWERRQEKWQKSLIESNYNNENKDSKSISYFKTKYGDDWIEKYLSKVSFKNKNDIMYLISFENYKDMILTLINDNFKLGIISYKIKHTIISEVYSTSIEDMYSFLLENYENDYGSPSYYERLYGDNWVNKFIKSNNYKNEDEVRYLLSFNDHNELIRNLIDNYSITDIVLKIKNKIISHFYKTTYEDMFNCLMNLNPFIKSKFGYMRYFNNHLCRSGGEFTIAKFLYDNNISYLYEIKYPNSNKRCDFYLDEFGIYLEYTGMSKMKKFKDNYKEKELFCINNNIKHIFSNNIENIKSEIKKIYGI